MIVCNIEQSYTSVWYRLENDRAVNFDNIQVDAFAQPRHRRYTTSMPASFCHIQHTLTVKAALLSPRMSQAAACTGMALSGSASVLQNPSLTCALAANCFKCQKS